MTQLYRPVGGNSISRIHAANAEGNKAIFTNSCPELRICMKLSLDQLRIIRKKEDSLLGTLGIAATKERELKIIQ